jgi:tRNA (mo5U34)-methyltransferase
MSAAEAMRSDLQAEVERLGPWFHNIRLPGGIDTAPSHFLGDYPQMKFRRFADALPKDMSGKTVLDIGCNAGFYSFEMKRRGAAHVLGIDSDEHYLRQARFVAKTCGFEDCEFRCLDVWQIAELGRKFDFVIFMGVLYHLRHPLLALDLIREHAAADIMLFQTMQRGSEQVAPVPEDHPFHDPATDEPPAYFDAEGYPKLHFIEREYAGDWTNWWAPNRACSEAMLRASGFSIEARLEAEVYLCRVADIPYAEHGPAAVYPSKGGVSR